MRTRALRVILLTVLLLSPAAVFLGCTQEAPALAPFADDFEDGRSTLASETHDLSSPQVLTLAAGRTVLVGLAYESGAGEGDRVFASFLSGGAWTAPTWVSGGPAACGPPRALALAGGGLLVVWSQAGPGGWDLYARVHPGVDDAGPDAFGPIERVTRHPGPDLQPALALSVEGVPHLAFTSRRDGRLDVFATRRADGAWTPAERLTDRPQSDFEPALGVTPDGALWMAWTGQPERHAGFQLFVQQLAPRRGPRTELFPESSRRDGAPTLLETRDALVLTWTRASSSVDTLGELTAPVYDRWNDKLYCVTELSAGRPGTVRELRLAPNTKATSSLTGRATPVEGKSREVWLLYGETARSGPLSKAFQGRLCRVAEHGASRPLELMPALHGPGTPPSAAWNRRRTKLLVARTVHLDTRTGAPRGRSWLEVSAVPAAGLPAATPAPDQPPPPGAGDWITPHPAEVERVAAAAGGRTWTAWFGNLHVHTDLSRDARGQEGSPFQNYLAVREVAGLDFAMLSDHVEWLLPLEWWQVRKAAELWNEPGRFVTLPGYEWTSLEYGHKNVVFPEPKTAAEVSTFTSRGHTPDDLWRHLAGRPALTIPHHPSHALSSPTDWSFRDDRYQRLVEIFQRRGSYEVDGGPLAPPGDGERGAAFVPGHSVRDALGRGHRLGFVASPDHGGGFGAAGVWAEELTRAALYEGLQARRTFATSGPRMALFLTLDGAPQGSELTRPVDRALELQVRVVGTAAGLEAVLVMDGEELPLGSSDESRASFAWTDPGPRAGSRYYYVRVKQGDGHYGWTSPVWVDPPQSSPR